MNRDAFLHILCDGLAGLPSEEIDDILADYVAHFDEAHAAGRSEEEVAAALGDPRRLARELRAEAGLRHWENHRSLGSLKTVTVQLWASERGGDGVLSKFIEDVKGLLPSPPDYHVVYDAGHFAFLAPWTPGQVAAAAPDLCIDSNELRARRLQSVQCGGQRVLSAAP